MKKVWRRMGNCPAIGRSLVGEYQDSCWEERVTKVAPKEMETIRSEWRGDCTVALRPEVLTAR